MVSARPHRGQQLAGPAARPACHRQLGALPPALPALGSWGLSLGWGTGGRGARVLLQDSSSRRGGWAALTL